MTEHEHRFSPAGLPPELAAAIQEPAYACLTAATEQGTAFIIKTPGQEIERVRGRVPVQVTHQLFDHLSAPVVRMTVRIVDDPLAPLSLETFINVADPAQRADYAALADQSEIPLLFYDEALTQRLAKRISHRGGDIVPEILATAEELLARIPPERFSFEHAKAAVQEVTRL